MPRCRGHSIEFKKQIAQEDLGGGTLKGLAMQHDLSRNLIRLWVAKYEAGGVDEDVIPDPNLIFTKLFRLTFFV